MPSQSSGSVMTSGRIWWSRSMNASAMSDQQSSSAAGAFEREAEMRSATSGGHQRR